MRPDSRYRYQKLAEFITRLVDGGTLVPGSCAPSLREISREHGVSLSTALQAYRLLEDRGVLEARPQSGFYIAKRRQALFEAPTTSNPPRTPHLVSISADVQQLLEHARNPQLAPLGCAIPDPDLLAAGKLNGLLARAARLRGAACNTYTVPKGDPVLRRELARRAAHWGHALSPEELVVTCGCTEALSLALQAVTHAGDTVAIESPTYFGLLHAIEMLGLRVLELPTGSLTGIDLVAVERALRDKSIKACLLASSFSNPLGCTLPDEGKLQLLRLLTKHRVPLIEDDIYGDIFFGERRPRPFSALDPSAEIIYCSSFSKTIAPGYRIGWIAPGRHLSRVLDRKLAGTLSGPALVHTAFADYLASGSYDRHLRRFRRVLQNNMERMMLAIRRAFPKETRVARPSGGFVLWLELPKSCDTRELFRTAVDNGICFAPGDMFSATRRYTHCMRLSCGHLWGPRIERAVETLGQLAHGLLGRKV
jgi:DNA-binding transcriptional MocR family regulator